MSKVPDKYKVNHPPDRRLELERTISRLHIVIAEQVFQLDINNQQLIQLTKEYDKLCEVDGVGDCEVVVDKLSEGKE